MYATHFLLASPYNILILLAVILFVAKAVRLFSVIKNGDANESNTSTGLTMLLLLSGAMILLGCFGYFSELAAAPCKAGILPGSSFVTVVCTVTDSVEQVNAIATCFTKSISAMATGLFAAAASGLTWFLLQQKIAK